LFAIFGVDHGFLDVYDSDFARSLLRVGISENSKNEESQNEFHDRSTLLDAAFKIQVPAGWSKALVRQ
jgi:hypothetical protein